MDVNKKVEQEHNDIKDKENHHTKEDEEKK